MEQDQGSLAKLLRDQFGVRTRAVENALVSSVGTTATKVAGNNPRRLALTIVNLSTNAMYVSLTSDVASTRGIRLSAGGGSVTLTWNEDFQTVGWEWWAVAAGVSSAIYVLECVSY